MSELKPCPFCGMPAFLRNENDIDTLYYARCSYCGAQSNCGTKEEVTEAWNRRADEQKLREELKKVMYAMSILSEDSVHSAKGILARVVHKLWHHELWHEEEGDSGV